MIANAGASLDVNINSLISSQITIKIEASVRVPTIPAVHSDLKPATVHGMIPAALAAPGFIEHHRGSCRFGLMARAKSGAKSRAGLAQLEGGGFPSRKRDLKGSRSLAPLARPHADRGRSHALMTTARGRIRNPTGKRPRPSPAPSTRAVIWRCAPPKAPRQIPTLPFAQTRIQPSERTWSWMKLGGAIIRRYTRCQMPLDM
jgi:hypothetical protein